MHDASGGFSGNWQHARIIEYAALVDLGLSRGGAPKSLRGRRDFQG